eukprot:TRINITY_DN31547_c0_g1_i1.p1 TRINITY_DN31547_c0_g1~~TRINITY_DN31547_c0_g1_i1.p1  ORF type:complete len:499 (-),score=86.45 TRINITY_DN31547_c0_g1_i1:55-1551(-)
MYAEGGWRGGRDARPPRRRFSVRESGSPTSSRESSEVRSEASETDEEDVATETAATTEGSPLSPRSQSTYRSPSAFSHEVSAASHQVPLSQRMLRCLGHCTAWRCWKQEGLDANKATEQLHSTQGSQDEQTVRSMQPDSTTARRSKESWQMPAPPEAADPVPPMMREVSLDGEDDRSETSFGVAGNAKPRRSTPSTPRSNASHSTGISRRGSSWASSSASTSPSSRVSTPAGLSGKCFAAPAVVAGRPSSISTTNTIPGAFWGANVAPPEKPVAAQWRPGTPASTGIATQRRRRGALDFDTIIENFHRNRPAKEVPAGADDVSSRSASPRLSSCSNSSQSSSASSRSSSSASRTSSEQWSSATVTEDSGTRSPPTGAAEPPGAAGEEEKAPSPQGFEKPQAFESENLRTPDPSADAAEDAFSEDCEEDGLPEESVITEAMATLDEDLLATHGNDLTWKRKHFKRLLLRLHPDKNLKDFQLATHVFQQLLQRKDWYLRQ